MTDLKMNAKLHAKIENVAKEIGHQEKKGTNKFSRYNFTSNEQMMTAVRGALLKNKLSLTCEIVDYEETTSINEKGKQVIRSVVKIEVCITDIETGFSKISKGIGAEQDTTGKSLQQAVTQAFKYWIFKNFKVSSQMEKDPDAQTVEAANVKTEKTYTTAEVLANIKKCKTTNCIKKWYDAYGHLDGVKAACTAQKKIISQSK